MRHSVFLLFMTMIIIVFMTIVMGALVDLRVGLITNERVETALIASGWSGFSFIELTDFSLRKEMGSRELRNVVIKKTSATTDNIKALIKSNLKLNDDLSPTRESFLLSSLRIAEINIYNPDELPVVINGEEYDLTTIELRVEVPVKVPNGPVKYFEKTVIVNANSFLTDEQT